MTQPWKGAARPLPPQAMEDAARKIGCDTAALRAVWDVEAAGQYYLSDGSVIRRFEPHHMPGSTMDWRDSLAISGKRREQMFLQAYREQPDAALRATSWGAAQIMGFNAKTAGYGDAEAMVLDAAESAECQVDAFVGLVQAWGLDSALRGHDWRAFARRWNGSGKVDDYARKIESAYRRHSGGQRSPEILRTGSRGAGVKRLQRALSVSVDGVFGPRTHEAVEKFQSDAGLAVDGVVGQRTWAALEAARGAKPTTQKSRGEDMADKASKYGAAASAASAAAASVNRVIPPDALPTIYIIAATVLGGAALIYAWRRFA